MGIDKFLSQIKFIHENYEIIDIDKALKRINGNYKCYTDAVVISFDDGYKDNYQHAYPILKKYNIPSIIYLTTGCVNKGLPTFIYSLILAIEDTISNTLDLTEIGLPNFRLDSLYKKEQAIIKIDQFAKKLTMNERNILLEKIIKILGLNHKKIFKDKMLNWDEINEMAKNNIEFGAHTINHPMLTNITNKEAMIEIEMSKQELENRIGKKITSFAYPYGNKNAVNKHIVNMVRSSGYGSAVVLHKTKRLNEFLISRKMISNKMTSNLKNSFSKAMFACEICGIWDIFFRNLKLQRLRR